MPARSKRSKANQKISRKKYRVDPEVHVEEPELNKALDNHDFAEDETQVEYDGTESETQSPNANVQYMQAGLNEPNEDGGPTSKAPPACAHCLNITLRLPKSTDSNDRAIYTEMTEMPVAIQNVGYQCPVEYHAKNQSHSIDERAEDETAGEVVQPITDETEGLVNLNSARSWSDSLAKLEALRNPNLSDSGVKNLEAIKSYFEDRLKGINKLHSSLNISHYSYRKGKYRARLVRRWAVQFQRTGQLPVASQRGKHSKRQSPLSDEDIKRKCLTFFRGLRPNNRTAQTLKKFNVRRAPPAYSRRFHRCNYL
ncbi:hypothetical protein V1523DRAFT_436949 [Lipomyces doorenjongii]